VVKRFLNAAAPSAIGRMTVATPAAKTNVIAIRSRRFWNELAKNAGSITEMQHGANKAIDPATTAARTEPPKKMPLPMFAVRPKSSDPRLRCSVVYLGILRRAVGVGSDGDPVKRFALVLLIAVLPAACARATPLEASASPDAVRHPQFGLFDTTPSGFDRLVRDGHRTPTVVNVWASWCIPCRAEAPLLTSAAKRYAGRVRFIGVDTKDDRSAGGAFIRKYGLPYASAFDPKGAIAEHLRTLGVPTTLFYSPAGGLEFVHNGQIHEADLREKLEQLVISSRTPG